MRRGASVLLKRRDGAARLRLSAASLTRAFCVGVVRRSTRDVKRGQHAGEEVEVFKRGERVVLVRTLGAPHDVRAGTLGTVLSAVPDAYDDVLVKVAFDGHFLKGGLNVSGHDVRLVPGGLGDPQAGVAAGTLAAVA
jgi:hypothetical protein